MRRVRAVRLTVVRLLRRLGCMAHPDPSQPLDAASVLARLSAVEDAVQELRFVHVVKVDAVQSGLGIMYGQLQHVQQELTGFRAEVAAELGVLKSEQAAQGAKLDEHSAMLAEILRRLPPAADE